MKKEKINKEILKSIENPIVKMALQRRFADFMFNYGDEHSDINHTDKSHRVYNDAWRKYDDHTDHSDYDDSHWDEYNDLAYP